MTSIVCIIFNGDCTQITAHILTTIGRNINELFLMAYISATTEFQQIIFILKFKHYQMNVLVQ